MMIFLKQITLTPLPVLEILDITNVTPYYHELGSFLDAHPSLKVIRVQLVNNDLDDELITIFQDYPNLQYILVSVDHNVRTLSLPNMVVEDSLAQCHDNPSLIVIPR